VAAAAARRHPSHGSSFHSIGKTMISRTLIRHIDWILILLLFFNSLIGVAVIYSSSHYLPGNYHLRQLFWIAVGLLALLLFLTIDYNVMVTYSLYFYAVCVVLLLGVLVYGRIISGAKSWFRLPFFQIQPSEITKLAVILLLGLIFSRYKKAHLSGSEGILSGIVVFVPIILISLQPDLGTAMSYIVIFFAALLLAGLNRKIVLTFLILSLIVGVVGWNFAFKDYQKQRVITLLNPEQDPLGSGYHILQSKIAVGSGGFLGKGFKKGSQSQLRFLPARHTDFVFSVIGEEFGFIGVIVLLFFYFLFLAKLFLSVEKARDRTGVYLIYMVAMLISCQFFINILMTIGLFPVAGIPLPLLSYGGSSLLTNYLAVALVINVKMRRFVNI
jgi:rod shape determining protein RodA